MAFAAKQPEQKRVTITSKRQFTIPQKFYTELGFDKEAICYLGDGMLVLCPVAADNEDNFAEEILTELISEGYSGEKLLKEFKRRQAKVRPAVEELLYEAKKVAEGGVMYSTYKDVFGEE